MTTCIDAIDVRFWHYVVEEWSDKWYQSELTILRSSKYSEPHSRFFRKKFNRLFISKCFQGEQLFLNLIYFGTTPILVFHRWMITQDFMSSCGTNALNSQYVTRQSCIISSYTVLMFSDSTDSGWPTRVSSVSKRCF